MANELTNYNNGWTNRILEFYTMFSPDGNATNGLEYANLCFIYFSIQASEIVVF